MRITVFGKGNVGGGLADLCERAGHQVTRLGRDGGDVSDAEVVLVAIPGGSIAEAFERLTGVEGKTVIDATNRIGVGAPDGFASNAEFVKSRTGGPTAKSFNVNFASLLGRLDEARVRPSNLWSGDEEAREVVEQLNREAGYDPVYTGPLENASRPGIDHRPDLRDRRGDG
jgi:predicted dinucleotide-binding enzyme